MRWLLRGRAAAVARVHGGPVALYLVDRRPALRASSRVFDSPDQHLTWVGFATYVTVMCGASLTLVTNIADFCRYTPTRRDMRIGLFASALTAAAVTTFVGGYAAAATGETNPFVAVADLTSSNVLLVVLLRRDRRPGHRREHHQRLHGRSLARELRAAARPRPGDARSPPWPRSRSPRFPDFVDHAQKLDHAPRQRRRAADGRHPRRLPRPSSGERIDVDGAVRPGGRYRYLNGVNVAALAASPSASASTTPCPQAWVKVVWGIGVGAAAYLVLPSSGGAGRRLTLGRGRRRSARSVSDSSR